jgi:hypothetical protein
LVEALIHTDAGIAALFSAVATIAAVLLAHWLRGRVNLITYSPNATYFQLKPNEPDAPVVHVRAGQIVIQNLGRQSARNVQITSVPGGAPAGYVILPSIVHSTRVGGNNEWIIEIPFIAPKETITLQILNGQNVDSVRSEDGTARVVPVAHQRIFPKWLNLIAGVLMLWGVLSFFFAIAWIALRS